MDDSFLDDVRGEVEFMRSAYGKEFIDLREKDVWKVYRSPEVQVTLGPHHSEGGTLHSHVSAVLKIATTEKYPNEPAKVAVESFAGLSDKEAVELTNQLERKATEFAQKGLVVMLELCQQAQNYLSEHARPYTDSIYDEMVAGIESRKKASEEAKEKIRRQQEMQEEAHRTFIQEEVARMKNRSLSECSVETGPGELSENAVIHFPQAGKQERVVVVVGFIKERRTQECCILEAREKGSMERSVIYQWYVKAKRTGKKGNHVKIGQETQLEKLNGKFSVLEKEMKTLLRLSHDNLVHYWGMKVEYHPNESISVCVLQEYVHGTSMTYFLDCNIPLNHLPLLRNIAEGTLHALSYLHQNNIVHRDLRDSCIYFDNLSHQVRVADYGVEKRIVELVVEFTDLQVLPVYPLSPGRGGKKGDVYRLGLVILSLFLGKRVDKIIPVLSHSLSSTLRDFIQRCLEINEQERWTTEQLLTHSFIRCSSDEKSPNKDQVAEVSPSSCESQTEDEEGCHEVGVESPSEVLNHLPSHLRGYSRLHQEYDILELLGKGGFGFVYKVRNKVDDRTYALKRIQLDQHSETVRKKIISEVKLLSSLNHENVVRYYTAWIDEFIQDQKDNFPSVGEDSADSTTSYGVEISDSSQVQPSLYDTSKDLSKKQCEESAKPDDSDWSIIFQDSVNHPSCTAKAHFSDESDEDDDDWLMGSLKPMLEEEDEDSDSAEFHQTWTMDQTDSVCDHPGKRETQASSIKKLQFLCIQMQLCEKKTLRQAINMGLYRDDDRMWRLFQEMVNGLDYIHSQGLIHRDLKPGNIFLDSTDRVKIGDFGLATAAIKAKTTVEMISKIDVEESKDSFLTGQVGTTLYIAPEVMNATGKVNYTKKVDVFSLGVIFFEMIYHPLTTGMERVKVLSDLRKPEIKFPEDLPKKRKESCTQLICWLLHHDPHSRPTTSDILKSPLLPPPTAEKQKFMETLGATLKNVRSSDYQEILNLVFKPSAQPELEATFEVSHAVSSDYWHYWKNDYLQSLFVAVFKAHGGIWVPTSFYTPKGSFYNDKDNLVSLMACRGELVSAQYELRYPFARFVARNEIKFMRRYCIDRVQRASKVSGIHPKEAYECAYDIVCAKRELSESSARVMLVAHDIIQQIIQRKSQGVYIHIRIGHMDLVHVILTYCGINEKQHPQVISQLKEWNTKRRTPEYMEAFINYICDTGVTRSSAESLKGFLNMNGPLEDVRMHLQNKMSSRCKDFSAIRQILADLQDMKEASVIIGIKFDIWLCPLMVADAHLYCGFMCQFLMDVPRKKTIVQDLLAQGGSYEHLILQHQSRLVSTKKKEDVPVAVGVSLFLEKFACCISDVNELAATGRGDISQVVSGLGCGSGAITVMVCAIGLKQLEDRVDIIRKLRTAKITADHCHCMTQKEAETVLEDLCVPNMVMLTNSEKADVRICNNPTSRTLERKVPLEKVAEFILKNLGINDTALTNTCAQLDPKPTGVNNQDEYQLNIQYITKKHSKSKDAPKLDQQITREVQTLICRWPSLGPNTAVDVWAVELDKKALLAFGALDTDTSVKNFNETVSDIKNGFPDQKDYIDEICKLLQRRIFPRKKLDRCLPLIFYSITTGSCKRII
ncbi:eIF-2-alpha kinase GCN2 isoform X2 [Panulirus ornatus]|uniref:eIF-2-alpha kinase GCN2 isoform X2 n=1 Tax=Panulirus ornatus TaxID=150431 RepID=UPI003A859462